MASWDLPIGLALLALACVVLGLFAVESRPGFDGGRSDVKERWFVHSRKD